MRTTRGESAQSQACLLTDVVSRRAISCGLAFVTAVVTMALLAIGTVASESFAQSDTTPPTLVALTIAPSTIDTGSGSATVTVTAHITDSQSGFSSGLIQFLSDTSTQVTAGSWSRTSGTANDGMYEALVPFAQYTAAGRWGANVILDDSLGNHADLNDSALDTLVDCND